MPKQRKLTNLLQGLQTKERAEFQAFLRSPFFIKHDAPARFFERLCKRYPARFEGEQYDWEAVFDKAFPGRGFNDHKLDTLLPALARLLEQFFAVKEAFPGGFSEKPSPRRKAVERIKSGVEKSPEPPQPTGSHSLNLQSQALAKRNLSPLFQAETERLIAIFEAKLFKDSPDYLALQQLHHQRYFHPDTPKFGAEAPGLDAAMENSDLRFFLDKLRYVAEKKTRQRLFGVPDDSAMLQVVLEKTAAPALLKNHPLLAIYHGLVNLLSNETDEGGFLDLQALALEKFDLLPASEKGILIHQLINYGIYLLEWDCPVEAALLALYKKKMVTEAPHFGERLTDGTFTNIVFLAASCGDLKWAEAFLSEFSPWLHETKRKDAVALANARLCYARQLLDEAHDWLNQVGGATPSYGVRSRGLRLKIAFDHYLKEGKDFLFLSSHLAAFEQYAEGQTQDDDRKLAMLNHIRFARKMAKMKFRKVTVAEKDKKRLRLQLRKMPRIINRHWLAQKIEEL